MFPAYNPGIPKDMAAPGVETASKGAAAGNNQQAVLEMFRQLQRQIPGFENIPSPSAIVEQQRKQHDKELFKGVSRSNLFAQCINRGGVEQGLKTDEQAQVANMAIFGGSRVDQSHKESGADLFSDALRGKVAAGAPDQMQKKQDKVGKAQATPSVPGISGPMSSSSTSWQAHLLGYGNEGNDPDNKKKQQPPPPPDQLLQNYPSYRGYPQYPGYVPYPGYPQYPGYPYPGYQYPGYPPLPPNAYSQNGAYPNPQQNYPPYAYDQNGQPIMPPSQTVSDKQDSSNSSKRNPKTQRRERSRSPRRERERSPRRERERSPRRERERSPRRERERSPIRDRRRSPIRSCRNSPFAGRDRSVSPRRNRSRSRSPRKDRSGQQTRERPRSPRSMIKQGWSDTGPNAHRVDKTRRQDHGNQDHGNQARIQSEYDSLMAELGEGKSTSRNEGNNRGGGGGRGASGGRGDGRGRGAGGGRGDGRGRGPGGGRGDGRGAGGRGGRGRGGGGRGGGYGKPNDTKEEEEFSNPWLKSFEQLQAEYEAELRQEKVQEDDVVYVGSDEPNQWPWQKSDYKADRMKDNRQHENRSGKKNDDGRRDRIEVSRNSNEQYRDNRDRSDRYSNDQSGNNYNKNKDNKNYRSDFSYSTKGDEHSRDSRDRNDRNSNDQSGNKGWLKHYDSLKERNATREGSEKQKTESRASRDANSGLKYFPLPPPKQSSRADYASMPPPNVYERQSSSKVRNRKLERSPSQHRGWQNTQKDDMEVQDMEVEDDFVSDLARGKRTQVQKEKQRGRHEIQLNNGSKIAQKLNEDPNYYKSERDKIAEAMASASSSFTKEQSSTLADPRKPILGANISNPISKFMKTVGKSKRGVKIVARKYHLPGNCIGLLPPKMAQEVWEVLKKPPKLRDETLTDVQRWLSLGIIPVIQLIDMFGTGPREAKEVCRMTSDALTVLGYVAWNMSIKRRLLIRSSINKKYAPLCRTLNHISQFLFGDNLAKDLADIKFGSYKFQNSDEEDNDDRLSPNFKQTIFIGLALFGNDVDANLAGMINMACANDGDVDDLKEKYKIPQNCEFLLPSKINPEMWSLLSFSGLELDYKLQNVQLSIAEGIVPLMKLLWSVQEGKYDPAQALGILTDALALLGNSVYQLNTVRMESMLKTLPEQVHGYANWNWLGADQISGENLEKELESCDRQESERRAGLIRGVLQSRKNQAS